MPMKTQRSTIIPLILGLTLIFMISCGGSSGNSDYTITQSSSVVEGDVATFIAGTSIYNQQPPDGMLAGILKTIYDRVFTPAYAQLEGVIVEIVELGLLATTASDGEFRFTDVPAGDYTLAFSYNGDTETMPINVPPNSIITIEDIIIKDGSISVADIEIEAIDEDDDSMDDVSEDDESIDDDSEDDDGSDDDSSDDESSDDDSSDDESSDDESSDDESKDE